MNFISHYFLDHIYGNPYFNTGLAIPDFMGNINRRWKPIRNDEIQTISYEGIQLWKGIDAHVRADAIFHNSSFFKEQTLALRLRMEKNGLKDREYRLFFLAHISLELLLDRLILLQFPGIADRFYDDLDKVDDPILKKALQSGVNTEIGTFMTFIEKFREYKYVYTYLEIEKMIYALNRIMGRAKQEAFDEQAIDSLIRTFYETEQTLKPHFLKFFDGMRSELLLAN